MRRVLLVLAVLLIATPVMAADYITRVKKLTGAVKSASEEQPTNNQLRAITDSFIYAYPGAWVGTLEYLTEVDHDATTLAANLTYTVNPSNPDVLTDIGTLDDSDPPEYTTITFQAGGVLDRARSLHEIRMVRRFIRKIHRSQSIQRTAAVAGDAGKTPNEIREQSSAAADVESTTILGDDDDDPES